MREETLERVKEAMARVEKGELAKNVIKEMGMSTATYFSGKKVLQKGARKKPGPKPKYIDIEPVRAKPKVAVIVCDPDDLASVLSNLKGDQ